MNALDRSRRATRRTAALGAAAVALAAAWCARPPDRPAPRAIGAADPAPRGEPTRAGDSAPGPGPLAGFDAPLWAVEAPPSTPEPPPPRPPALAVRLLAIASPRDGTGERRAMLYDAARGEVVVVRAGEEIDGRRVQRIEAGAVHLAWARDARVVDVLRLDPGGAP